MSAWPLDIRMGVGTAAPLGCLATAGGNDNAVTWSAFCEVGTTSINH